MTSSVKSLLESDRFQNSNSELVPIYEKALQMMEAGQTGPVVVKGQSAAEQLGIAYT